MRTTRGGHNSGMVSLEPHRSARLSMRGRAAAGFGDQPLRYRVRSERTGRPLNDPRLQDEGFKRGRFEIDHRPRPPDLLLVMVPETTGMRCFGAQTGQTLKAQRATAAAVSSHDATSPILRF